MGQVAEALLESSHRGKTIGVHGMGGVGKTTLIEAICHDRQVIEAFPDGILWTTLGPQADVFSAQANWALTFETHREHR